jgi:hypothetical protein
MNRRTTLASLLLSALALTACGTDSTSTTADTQPSKPAVREDSVPAADSTAPTDLDEPAVTMPAQTDPADTGVIIPWTLQADPAWEPVGAGVWFTGTGSDSFQDNVNVITQPLPAAMTLDAYIDAALETVKAAPEFELIARDIITGDDGTEIGSITWTAALAGMPKLTFKQSIVVNDTTAYIATFTTEPERAAETVPTIGAALLTLRAA